MLPQTVPGGFSTVLDEVTEGIRQAAPKVLLGLLFVALAYVGIKAVLTVLRRILRRTYPSDERLVADLLVTVAGVFMWFGTSLVFLNIVGMGGIAASLGTATGFIALGIAYALSDMIADTVAGIYLLRDPDFNPGDRVEAGDVEGVVRSIELRKTRFEVEGDTVVVSNSEVEEKWRQLGG